MVVYVHSIFASRSRTKAHVWTCVSVSPKRNEIVSEADPIPFTGRPPCTSRLAGSDVRHAHGVGSDSTRRLGRAARARRASKRRARGLEVSAGARRMRVSGIPARGDDGERESPLRIHSRAFRRRYRRARRVQVHVSSRVEEARHVPGRGAGGGGRGGSLRRSVAIGRSEERHPRGVPGHARRVQRGGGADGVPELRAVPLRAVRERVRGDGAVERRPRGASVRELARGQHPQELRPDPEPPAAHRRRGVLQGAALPAGASRAG